MSELPVNHAEALELAGAKRNESNLARCYLALHDEVLRLQEQNLRLLADRESLINLGD